MRHSIKLLFITILFLPIITFGQFYYQPDSTRFIPNSGYVQGQPNTFQNDRSINGQDRTYWKSDSGYKTGSPDTLENDKSIGTGPDKNITISNDQSINANTTGTCKLELITGKRTISSYISYFGCLVRISILPVIFTLAVVSFIWGVVKMVTNSSNEEAQTDGKKFILTGIIGLFVILSMYALVNIIRRTAGFGFNAKDDPTQYIQLKDKVLRNK